MFRGCKGLDFNGARRINPGICTSGTKIEWRVESRARASIPPSTGVNRLPGDPTRVGGHRARNRPRGSPSTNEERKTAAALNDTSTARPLRTASRSIARNAQSNLELLHAPRVSRDMRCLIIIFAISKFMRGIRRINSKSRVPKRLKRFYERKTRGEVHIRTERECQIYYYVFLYIKITDIKDVIPRSLRCRTNCKYCE